MVLKEAAAGLGQDHGLVAVSRYASGLYQTRLAKVPEVTGTRIRHPTVVVSKVTTGDHSKGADGGQRARFRAAEHVLAIAVTNQLSLESTRQVEMPREWVAGLAIALAGVAVACAPARIRRAVAAAVFRALPLVPWTPTERPRIVLTPVVPMRSSRAPVAVAIAFIGAIAASAFGPARVPIVVA
jgi:hypothetical protein